ncbi:hypothetical protein PGT21_010459 [Puccinia graminis f. sp. tritici]|uniref:Uncharacterized protein n=1 Tax=Puccinia graminis f. sp. tritici TaxID=56615 RepID=A0A5B0Q5F5_PUCGR|nr:hypothetical protein PGT21_010459 [Puccinia graminis f. sp. tritici]
MSPPLSPLFCLEVHSSSVSHTSVSSYFPRCHPLSPPRTPRVTPPTPVGPGTPPAAPPPQYTLNPRSAVGRDPRRPPMPGLPALDFPLMHRRFPQPACVASAPRAFRISATSIPHAPNKPAKALAKARSRHHNGLQPTQSGPDCPANGVNTLSPCQANQ